MYGRHMILFETATIVRSSHGAKMIIVEGVPDFRDELRFGN